MENMRWILLLAGIGIVLGIFLLNWLPGKLKLVSQHRRVRPSVRARGVATAADKLGINVDGMVEEELEKLGQLVGDDAPGEQSEPMYEIGATPQKPAAADKVFSLYVLSPTGVPFRGSVLLGALADAGLEYGDMQIFHCYEEQDGQQLLFSLASIREPGIFDLSAMQDFTTDGLVLFIQIPGQTDAVKAFESMVAAARALASSLDGTVYDATNSVLTNQTIGHMREEVIAFQLQQRLAKRAS
jgi:cell division protein ZipA